MIIHFDLHFTKTKKPRSKKSATGLSAGVLATLF